jgi:hypothetical protein
MLEFGARFAEEADANEEDPFENLRVEEEDQWDCESILSTYTNTDNHPGVIKTTRRIRPSQQMKIELHKQFRVPIDGLIPVAEEITLAKEKKKKLDSLGPYTAAAEPVQKAQVEDEKAVPEDDL